MVAPPQHDGAGAVAEQDAGGPIRVVDDSRQRLGADHQGVLRRAGLHELSGRGHRVHEPGTASEPVDSAGPAIRRSLMPVRSVIHWSLVSTSCSRSALVRTYGGTAVPSPTISAATTAPFSSGPSCGSLSTVPVPSGLDLSQR